MSSLHRPAQPITHEPEGTGGVNGPKAYAQPALQKARMLHMLYLIESRDIYVAHTGGMEEQVDESRVKTFIELTRRALEEDRIGQPDIFYRSKPTLDHRRSDRKRESEGLKRKG